MRPRGIVGALFVVAVGAILAYAVHYTVAGINIRTVGFIIMAAGAVALIAVVARAFTDSQRQNRLEDRQDEQVRAANRPAPGIARTNGVYAHNPALTVPPVAPLSSPRAPDLVPVQRVGEMPSATTLYQTPESEQR
jgi:hypothetical protein